MLGSKAGPDSGERRRGSKFTMQDVWNYEEELARRHNASPGLREKIKRKLKVLDEEDRTDPSPDELV